MKIARITEGRVDTFHLELTPEELRLVGLALAEVEAPAGAVGCPSYDLFDALDEELTAHFNMDWMEG